MSENKPYVNFDMLNATKKEKKSEKKEKKTKKWKWRQKNKEEVNTRNIRFARNKVSNFLSATFFTLFIVMTILLIMFFGRIDTLTKVALKKQIKPAEIIYQMKKEEGNSEQMTYEGSKLLEILFTMKPDPVLQKERETNLKSYLSKNMSLSDIETLQGNTDRQIESIQFIEKDQKKVKEIGDIYYLTYEVKFTENGKGYKTQAILPVSFTEQDLKLLNIPTYTNLALSDNKKKNNAVYGQSNFYSNGDSINDTEQKKITEFLNQFFKLYLVDDPNLKLISNVKGIEEGKLDQLDLKNIVKGSDENYFVEGTIQFHYEGTNRWTSFFSLELKQNKDSYFVTQFNK